jgi:dimethylsulfoniopropionate demethylase
MPAIFPSRRVRRTPFTPGNEAAGVSAYTVYNRMLLPTAFGALAEDYRHLKSAVQVWDVACERQVQIEGPDAPHLMALISPRDLAKMQAGQCFYLPVCDAKGGMLNDPVALKLAGDRFWVSLADSDLLLWIKGIATALKLNVSVSEPDVSPLAVQGPKADELMARVFGQEARAIRFFRFAPLEFEGRRYNVARSGYSKQGGFEIYVEGFEHGMALWQALFAAGADLDVRAGCPNLIERIEGGLLSYGNDMTAENNPFECGLGKYVTSGAEYIGRAALEKLRAEGHAREIRAIAIEGPSVPPCDRPWELFAGRERAGQVTSAAYSPDFAVNVAIGMVERGHRVVGTTLEIEAPDGRRKARVQEKFWI